MPPETAAPTEATPTRSPLAEDRSHTTHHTVVIAGQRIEYTATAGIYVLKKEDGTPQASIFYIAYVREGVPTEGRPVTFSFNGGPGSSSVWLHLGALGPRRVARTDVGDPAAPPGRLEDNPDAILDVTDLVFIDPVTTGYSRAAKAEEAKDFHGVKPDIEAVADFIRLWTTRNRRWTSPKLLAGESYGTTRAAGLAAHLQERHAMYVNGLCLISSVLNFQTVLFHFGNDLPYVLHLPTYAAIAWYHGRIQGRPAGEDLRTFLREVEAWAVDTYAAALHRGDRLPAAERKAVAAQLSAYTGLGADWIERARLRILLSRFTQELLREAGQSVGRLDGRYKGIEYDAVVEHMTYDPSLAAITGVYAACLNHYVRDELGFESDLPYEILTDRVRPWTWSDASNRYLDVTEPLRTAMIHNPALRVFVANGYYDLGTPYFASEYTFDHLGLPEPWNDRVSMAWYEAGHMMYVHLPALRQLRLDLVAFLGTCTPAIP